MKKTCIAPDCLRPAHAMGMCPTHLGRWKKRGSFDAVRPRGTVEERFWAKVDKSGSGDCWAWTAKKMPSGYGVLWIGNGRLALAHRISYEMHVGTIPDGLIVMHSCDNPMCVNPRHLSVGTHSDNARDKVNKGRQSRSTAVGAACGLAKLSDEDARRIKAMLHMSNRDLAQQFGVSSSAIWCIRTGKTWRHIAD